jgi:hypothetical protein
MDLLCSNWKERMNLDVMDIPSEHNVGSGNVTMPLKDPNQYSRLQDQFRLSINPSDVEILKESASPMEDNTASQTVFPIPSLSPTNVSPDVGEWTVILKEKSALKQMKFLWEREIVDPLMPDHTPSCQQCDQYRVSYTNNAFRIICNVCDNTKQKDFYRHSIFQQYNAGHGNNLHNALILFLYLEAEMDFNKPCEFFTNENSHENWKHRFSDPTDQLNIIRRFIQYLKEEAIRTKCFTSILTLLKTKNIETAMSGYSSIQQFLRDNNVP